MKKVLLFMALGVACGSPPQVRAVKDREGRLQAEVSVVNGRKDGPVRFFHADGSLQTEGQYARDARHGAWTTVGPMGDTLSIVNYRHGRKDGLQAYWAENGQLLRIERFSKGLPDGPLYRFFADGSPRQITWYKDGVAEGTYMEWYKVDSTSIAITAGQFHHGGRTGRWTWFYGNGKPQRQGRYVGGRQVGTWRHWDPKGTLLDTKDFGQ